MIFNDHDDALADLETFDTFPELDDPKARAAIKAKRVETRAIRTRSRIEKRRAASQAVLAQILPDRIDDGDTWHVISGGNVDSLSYTAHLMQQEPFERLTLSTWCMALDDVQQLGRWLDTGALRRLDCYVGEIFPKQYATAYAELCSIVRRHTGRVATFRNHSKVMMLANDTTRRYLVIESSANINTNPHTEQTAVTADKSLHDFYAEFFDSIKSFADNFPDWNPHGRPPT